MLFVKFWIGHRFIKSLKKPKAIYSSGVFCKVLERSITGRVFSRDILKGGNIGVRAGGRGCIIFWKI